MSKLLANNKYVLYCFNIYMIIESAFQPVKTYTNTLTENSTPWPETQTRRLVSEYRLSYLMYIHVPFISSFYILFCFNIILIVLLYYYASDRSSDII